MKELTRDADRLVCLLYREYLQKRKDGVSKGDAKMFGGSDDIQSQLLPKTPVEDVDETCRELDRAGYVDVLYGGDVACEVILADTAIIYLENRFKDGLAGVLNFLSGFIP